MLTLRQVAAATRLTLTLAIGLIMNIAVSHAQCEDDDQPSAACVEGLTLMPDNNGLYYIPYQMVDNGSFDDCGIRSLSVLGAVIGDSIRSYSAEMHAVPIGDGVYTHEISGDTAIATARNVGSDVRIRLTTPQGTTVEFMPEYKDMALQGGTLYVLTQEFIEIYNYEGLVDFIDLIDVDLFDPLYITLDTSGNIFVLDSDWRVHKWDSDYNYIEPSQFEVRPHTRAFSITDDGYVATWDDDLYEVVIYDTTGAEYNSFHIEDFAAAQNDSIIDIEVERNLIHVFDSLGYLTILTKDGQIVMQTDIRAVIWQRS